MLLRSTGCANKWCILITYICTYIHTYIRTYTYLSAGYIVALGTSGCADCYFTETNIGLYDQYTQRVRIHNLKNDILRDESKNKSRKQYEA